VGGLLLTDRPKRLRPFARGHPRVRPALDPSPVIPSDLSSGYLSAELKSPVKIPIPDNGRALLRRAASARERSLCQID
jgi:hypothetical protein